VDGIELDFEMTSSRERSGHAGVRFWVLDAAATGTQASGTAQRVRLSLRAVGPDGDLLVKDHVSDTPD
jgi:predicted secreted protein